MEAGSATPERFRAVVDALPDVVYRISRELEVLDCWTGRFSPWFASPPGEIIGRRVDELVTGERLQRFATAIYAALESDEVVTCEFETDEHSAGPTMYRQARYARSGPDEVIGLTRDVTAERCFREAQRFLNDAGETLLGATPEDPEEAIAAVLRQASEFVGSIGMSVFAPSEAAPERFVRLFQWSDLGATLAESVDFAVPSEFTQLLASLEQVVVLDRDDGASITRLLDRYNLAALGYLAIGDPHRYGFVGAGFPRTPTLIQRLRFESMNRFGDLLGVLIERQRGEQRRRHATQLVNSLVERTSELIAVLERDGTLRYVSGPPVGFRSVIESTNEDSSLWGSVVPEDHADLTSAFELALRNADQPIPISYRVRGGSGEVRQLVGTLTNLLQAPAVQGVVLNARDVTEQRAAYAALERSARYDDLTGLSNREAFRDDLDRRLTAGGPIGVLAVDLDHFERINDGYGHNAGDTVLATVASRRDDLVAARGKVARFTGDKFLVAHPAHDESELRRFAETIRRLLNRPVTIDHVRVRLSASVGALIATPGRDTDTVLRDAEAALHRAKRQGGDRYSIWDDTFRREIDERAELEASLTNAVDRDELEVYYQPVIHLATGRPVGAEALVRWHRPGHGIISPGDFLGVAEETGLVHQVDLWMLRHAIHQIVRWHDHHLNIAVNLSVHELDQPDLESTIDTALATTGLAPRDLCLEITETGYAQATPDAIALLQRLRQRGVRIAIDDFGAGYSSIDRVRRFPVDVIKIDRSFVHTVADRPRDRAIVQAIIELAHALELQVIAEGIETRRQHQTLYELGCDHAQGFYYGSAMTAAEFASSIATMERTSTPLRRVQ